MVEILRYFSENIGFSRLMNGMWDMYSRHGRAFGAVRLDKPQPYEERAMSDFFKRDYYDQALIRIGLAEFERQMQMTFSDAPGLGVFLEGYFARPLTASAKFDKNQRKNHPTRDGLLTHIKAKLLPLYTNTDAEYWLKDMLSHMRRTYKLWAERFNAEESQVHSEIKHVCEALNALPHREYVLLADYSAKICGDSSALDFYGSHGQLFMRALSQRFGTNVPVFLEDSIHLYWQAGLLSNGVLNQVTVSGVLAYSNEADAACAHYDTMGEAHVLTLENISRYTRVDAHNNTVYVIENANVFALVCEKIRGVRATLVCAAAGMNAALDRLLTLCCESGAKVYYSGNFDPKGLTWGDMLYLRFHKNFVPWRYTKEDYETALKDAAAILPDEKKKVSLHNEAFASLLSTIRKNGKSAAQLPLAGILAEDIRRIQNGK
jgi:uncharacterized protein (TIGR02679 family)